MEVVLDRVREVVLYRAVDLVIGRVMMDVKRDAKEVVVGGVMDFVLGCVMLNVNTHAKRLQLIQLRMIQ